MDEQTKNKLWNAYLDSRWKELPASIQHTAPRSLFEHVWLHLDTFNGWLTDRGMQLEYKGMNHQDGNKFDISIVSEEKATFALLVL